MVHTSHELSYSSSAEHSLVQDQVETAWEVSIRPLERPTWVNSGTQPGQTALSDCPTSRTYVETRLEDQLSNLVNRLRWYQDIQGQSCQPPIASAWPLLQPLRWSLAFFLPLSLVFTTSQLGTFVMIKVTERSWNSPFATFYDFNFAKKSQFFFFFVTFTNHNTLWLKSLWMKYIALLTNAINHYFTLNPGLSRKYCSFMLKKRIFEAISHLKGANFMYFSSLITTGEEISAISTRFSRYSAISSVLNCTLPTTMKEWQQNATCLVLESQQRYLVLTQPPVHNLQFHLLQNLG